MTEEYNERVKTDRRKAPGQEMNNQTPRGSKEVSMGVVVETLVCAKMFLFFCLTDIFLAMVST